MRASRLFLFMISFLLGLSLIFGSVVARAFDEDESIGNVSGTAISKAQHRLYPGGRDEQNLEIQPAITQPTRSLTGAAVVSGVQKPSGQDEESAPPGAPTEPPEVD